MHFPWNSFIGKYTDTFKQEIEIYYSVYHFKDSLDPMSPEILWLNVLQPGGIHETATSDISLACVDHFSENYNLEKCHSAIKHFFLQGDQQQLYFIISL